MVVVYVPIRPNEKGYDMTTETLTERDAFATTDGRGLIRFTLDAPVVDIDEPSGRATYAFALTHGPTLVDYVQVAGADRRSAFEDLRYLHGSGCRHCGSGLHWDDDCTR